MCYSSAKYFNRGQRYVDESHDQTEIEKNAEIENKFILTLADVYLQGVVRSDDIYESGKRISYKTNCFILNYYFI